VKLLDTNVLSELMKPAPHPGVVRWLDAQPTVDLWICAITIAEIRLGIALLPDGTRKTDLGLRAEAMLDYFAEASIAFDTLAASEYASIVAQRRKAGRPIGVEDAQIAAIARSAGLTLATRNLSDFADIDGLGVVDPWTA